MGDRRSSYVAAYSTALTYFVESCHKLNLDEIDRRDLLKFSAFLRDSKNQSPRSVYNKFENVMTFLKANGIRGLVGKNDWPRFTEEEPENYEQEELDIFTAYNRPEQLIQNQLFDRGAREFIKLIKRMPPSRETRSVAVLRSRASTRLTNRVISCESPQITLSTRSTNTVDSLRLRFDGMSTGCPDGAGYRLADLFQAQLAIVLLGDPVALTGEVLKFLAVHDLHRATGVLNKLLLLQNTSCQAHARPVCP